jgi:hypothetical protein
MSDDVKIIVLPRPTALRITLPADAAVVVVLTDEVMEAMEDRDYITELGRKILVALRRTTRP